jgi:RNA polymerase sigma-70 factor, ECF subfamily
MQRERLTAVAVPTTELEDARLVAKMARGDREALAALYDRHAPLLLALGTRILGDQALAEDVLHDVFLEAWHRAAAFDADRGSARAWLVTRMRSRILDRRDKVVRGEKLARDAAQTAATATAEAIAATDHDRIRAGVAGLSEELGAIVDLAYFEGLSTSEIARRLDLPVGTVKSRLARALAFLRQRLHPESGGAP